MAMNKQDSNDQTVITMALSRPHQRSDAEVKKSSLAKRGVRQLRSLTHLALGGRYLLRGLVSCHSPNLNLGVGATPKAKFGLHVNLTLQAGPSLIVTASPKEGADQNAATLSTGFGPVIPTNALICRWELPTPLSGHR